MPAAERNVGQISGDPASADTQAADLAAFRHQNQNP
jgi:hypothetical protein